ncbi:MAG: hypothetical protein CMH52_13590 [Myxococcales bacterium]|nr:hypothetical protein [Myxococcales bacterium]
MGRGTLYIKLNEGIVKGQDRRPKGARCHLNLRMQDWTALLFWSGDEQKYAESIGIYSHFGR